MQTLYFVRHGQTELNLAKKVQGNVDSPLLEASKEEAKKTGQLLRQTDIKRVISSPQLRALDTAKLILSQFEREVPLVEDERLKEMGYGQWEGLSIPELAEKHPELFRYLREEPHRYDPTEIGGETYTSLIERGTHCVRHHANQHPEEELLFVGHSIHLMSTILTLVGYPVNDIRSYPPLGNTSVTKVLRDGDHFEIDTWNYVTHLEGL